jgi:hypothetical protein
MRSSTTSRHGLHLNAGRTRPSSRPALSIMYAGAFRTSRIPIRPRRSRRRTTGGGVAERGAGIGNIPLSISLVFDMVPPPRAQ